MSVLSSHLAEVEMNRRLAAEYQARVRAREAHGPVDSGNINNADTGRDSKRDSSESTDPDKKMGKPADGDQTPMPGSEGT